MTGADPLVSVVICTQNRAALVGAAIASLSHPAPPRAPYEIIVVDNGSVDGTAAAITALGNPLLTCLHEPIPGLSRARNLGWRAARGSIIAFLDDDATACPGWIDAIAAGLEQDAGAGAIGGPVVPVWHAPRPDWLMDEVAHALTILDWGPGARRLDIGREWIVGANMAFRRPLLDRTGGFEPRLGRQGDLLLSAEETFLLRQIDRLGHGVLYWPQMQVLHPVPKARLNRRWLVQRHYWQGVSDATICAIEGSASVERALQAARALPAPQPMDGAKGFTLHCRAARQAGFVAGLLGGARP